MSAITYAKLAPEVFQAWSEHWRTLNCAPPPLVLYKTTMNGGLIMLAPLPAPWVREFDAAHATDSAVFYEAQGETLTEGSAQFFGVWAAFTATYRSNLPSPKGRPVLPMAVPMLRK